MSTHWRIRHRLRRPVVTPLEWVRFIFWASVCVGALCLSYILTHLL